MRISTIIVARQTGLLVVYTAALLGSLWLSYQLRFDFNPSPEHLEHAGLIFPCLIALKLLLLVSFGQFGSLLSYFGIHDVQKIFASMGLASILAFGAWTVGGVTWAPPRAVILADLIISFLALCLLRMGFRMLREGYFRGNGRTTPRRRNVAIIGAGDVGASLAKDFLMRPGLGMKPVAFFDDNPRKWKTNIHGVSVMGAPDRIPQLLRELPLDEVIIAMPSASGKRVKEIVQLLTRIGLKFEIVPSMEQLINGQVRISQIRPVEIQDLLGREPVTLETDKIRQLVHGKVALVTGAGGSIGGELCRQIASYSPQRLLLVERSEFQLFQVEQELIELGCGAEIVPLVADLLDESRMRGIFQRFAPALVFHAAAHKHVPMMEHQPAEAIRNNALGTRLLANFAAEFSVERFVLISTDKAINPTSVMGATKRLAELYLQAFQRDRDGTATKFMAVRFGNVLGSSGSVIPTFKKQIAAGGPVTVTHPEITRYFMTVQEAVGLVLQSATLGIGGEIFVLDMGKPIKIVDVARQLIELSGLAADTDIEIKFTGLRPGEKLFEEINHNSELLEPTGHGKIFRFTAAPGALETLNGALDKLGRDLAQRDPAQLKSELKRLIPEYTPYLAPM